MEKLSRPRRQTTARRRELTYGLDGTAYKVLFTEQNGRCALCLEPKELHIDHDHKTGRVRGLLCRDCNTSLGKLGDDVEGIRRVLAYLVNASKLDGLISSS
jgi:hypothetical protein